MLAATDVTKTFGGLVAVDRVSFEIGDEEIVGLIGPNGAGKTTLFDVVTGVYRPETGRVTLNDVELSGKKPHHIARLGVVRTFQTARTFHESTVLENVRAGAVFGGGVGMDASEERAYDCLEFVGLGDRATEEVGSLTVADRKLLEMARGIATDPEYLLVDEVGSGLTAAELETLTSMIERVRTERGISVFWIEHIMDAIMDATDRIIVLDQGRKIAEGNPEQIQRNEQVVEAYLGEA